MAIRRAIELLKEGEVGEALLLLESKDTIFIEWSTQDVLDVAENMHRKISKRKARQILADIEHHHDCSYGITWDTIQDAIHFSTSK
jgi:hypothetical protein